MHGVFQTVHFDDYVCKSITVFLEFNNQLGLWFLWKSDNVGIEEVGAFS